MRRYQLTRRTVYAVLALIVAAGVLFALLRSGGP
jgi:hypothetical protein